MLLFNRAEGRQLTNHDREIESLAEEGTDDRKNTFTLMNEKHSTNNCWIKNMLLTTVAVVLLSGCSYYRGLDDYRGRPKLRKGAVACQSIPNKFIGVEEIGPHRYQYSFKEKVGIVYTDKAGHIDIGHLRKSADWTAYLSGLCRQHLSDGKRQWQYELTEPTRYSVRLTYPPKGSWCITCSANMDSLLKPQRISVGWVQRKTFTDDGKISIVWLPAMHQ